MSNSLIIQNNSAFSSLANFELAQRMSKPLCESDLVPDVYRGNLGNCIIALEIAQRQNASPLMVMQNLDIIYGRPSWRSQFIISAINTCGRFSPLRFELTIPDEAINLDYEIFETKWEGKTKRTVVTKKTATIKNKTCVAWTTERGYSIPQSVYDFIAESRKEGKSINLLQAVREFSLPIFESPEISIEMACREGWYDKSGSKWKSMDELMLRYRAAAFFGRLYAPEILMGMQTAEENEDIYKDVTPPKSQDSVNRGLSAAIVDMPIDPNHRSLGDFLAQAQQPIPVVKESLTPDPIPQSVGNPEELKSETMAAQSHPQSEHNINVEPPLPLSEPYIFPGDVDVNNRQ